MEENTPKTRARKLREDVAKFNAEALDKVNYSMTVLYDDDDDIVIVREESPQVINFLTSTHWVPSGPCCVYKPQQRFDETTRPASFSMSSGGDSGSSPLQITMVLMLVCKFANEELLALSKLKTV